MRKKSLYLLLFLPIFLLLTPSYCIEGMRQGLTLFGLLLLPSIFPFLILSKLFKQLIPGSDTTAFYLFIGLFSGFPVAAAILAKSQNSKIRSDFLLGLINNPSPGFILTYVGVATLHLGIKRFLFYFLLLVSLFIGNLVANHLLQAIHPSVQKTVTVSKCSYENTNLDSILWDSIQTILKIGGYVLIFSTVTIYLKVLPIHHPSLRALLTGLCELTCGISSLINPAIQEQQKIVLAAILTSFGGVCSILQTYSVIDCSGLSLINYIIRRSLCAITAGILFFLFF